MDRERVTQARGRDAAVEGCLPRLRDEVEVGVADVADDLVGIERTRDDDRFGRLNRGGEH